MPDLANIGHRLKPSFHYLGRPDLNELLGVIENGDGTKKDEEIFAAANKFLSGYAIMIIEVDEYLEKLKQA